MRAARESHANRRRLPLAVGTLIIVTLFALARILGRGTPRVGGEEVRVESNEGLLIVVDAGSSGSRAHVFHWSKNDGRVVVEPKHESMKVTPGLSSFADEPTQAGESLQAMLDFLNNMIPEESRPLSPIYLKATAGLRQLPAEKAEAILQSVRTKLANCEYKFDETSGAQVIAGSDEGGFGWLSVNYLLKNLDSQAESPEWVGVIEMGGASAQVTQLVASNPGALRGSSSVPEGYGFTVNIGGVQYDLYAQSYLGYGLEAARETFTEFLIARGTAGDDPCLNQGFVKTAAETRASVYEGAPDIDVSGAGNFAKCRDFIELALFPPGGALNCKHPSCSNIKAAFQPANLATTKLLLFENFYYTASMLGLNMPRLQPQKFRFEAKSVCAAEWKDLQRTYPKDGPSKDDLAKLCFSAIYLDLFLEKGLRLKPEKEVLIQQQVDGADIDWSLGAAIHEANKLVAF